MRKIEMGFNGEKEKIRKIPGLRAKAEYIWQYYKLWIIGIVCLVLFVVYAVFKFNTAVKDNWFYITIANTNEDVGNDSEFWESFVEYGGFDIKEKNVMFNTNCYFNPENTRNNQYYTYFVAYVEAGTLDGIIMEKKDIELLGESGRLMDLSNADIAGKLSEKYADRLVYSTPKDTEYSDEPVPVGIDLSDTKLISKYHIYADNCVLGISANAQHMEALELFLEFVMDEEA